MSHIEIFKFDENGDSESYGEVSNAWLGSMRVWNILGEKYCGHGASLFDMGQMEAIWNLVDDKSVTYDEKSSCLPHSINTLLRKKIFPKLLMLSASLREIQILMSRQMCLKVCMKNRIVLRLDSIRTV